MLVLAVKEEGCSVLQLYETGQGVEMSRVLSESVFEEGYLGYHLKQVAKDLFVVGLTNMQENIPSKAKSCIKLVKLISTSQNKYRLLPILSEPLEGTLWNLLTAEIDSYSFILACVNKNICFFSLTPEGRIKMVQSSSFDYPIQAVEYRANKLFITFFCA